MKGIVQRLSPPVKTVIYWGTWHKPWNVQIQQSLGIFHILACVNMIEIIHSDSSHCAALRPRRAAREKHQQLATGRPPHGEYKRAEEPDTKPSPDPRYSNIHEERANPSCDPHSTCICSVGSHRKCARGKKIWDEASNVYLAAREHFSTP